jgi:AraC family transcriptional regulator, transcriptional activator of pobA
MAWSTAIPRYQLYGEEDGVRPFDFVHIEPLRERSEPHDWAIDVHTHAGLDQVVVFLGGGLQLTVEERVSPIEAPAAATIPSGVAHGLDLDRDSTGWVLMLAEDQLHSAELGRWLRGSLLDDPVVLPLESQGAREVADLCEALHREQVGFDVAHDAVAQWLTLTLLTVLARRRGPEGDGSALQRADRFGQFRRMVEEHFAEHRPVAWYAERLHLSESSLNRLCQRSAGRSAFELTQARLELEARRRLRYTPVPVGVLARELGFEDQSYFARFFRRRVGTSPSVFRRTSPGARPV